MWSSGGLRRCSGEEVGFDHRPVQEVADLDGVLGVDVVNIVGLVNANNVTINAETIDVSGTIDAAGDIVLNAVAAPPPPLVICATSSETVNVLHGIHLNLYFLF